MDQRYRAKIAVYPHSLADRLIDRSVSLFDWIERAGTMRADGLELHPLFLERTDKPYLRRVKEAAAKQHLKLPLMRTEPNFTRSESAYLDDELQNMKDMIDAMAILGPPEFRSCRVLLGRPRPGEAPEETARRIVYAIRELLPYAERSNVCLVVEHDGQDLRMSRLLADMIKPYFSPSLGFGYAPSRAQAEGEDALAQLENVKNRMFTVRTDDWLASELHAVIARAQGRSSSSEHSGNVSDTAGNTDKEAGVSSRLFAALRQVRFRGWISVGDGVGGLDEMAASVRLLREKIGVYLA